MEDDSSGVDQRRGQRARELKGLEREQLASELAARYRRGVSIRELALDVDVSFGFARTLLLEHGVELRPRGGKRGGRRRT